MRAVFSTRPVYPAARRDTRKNFRNQADKPSRHDGRRERAKEVAQALPTAPAWSILVPQWDRSFAPVEDI
jgi:hypothetical protein